MTKWIAGYGMTGQAPTFEPVSFAHFNSARLHLLERVKDDIAVVSRDAEGLDDVLDDLNNIAEHLLTAKILPRMRRRISSRELAAKPIGSCAFRRQRRALRDLLGYTGGFDIIDPQHPIYRARMALASIDKSEA